MMMRSSPRLVNGGRLFTLLVLLATLVAFTHCVRFTKTKNWQFSVQNRLRQPGDLVTDCYDRVRALGSVRVSRGGKFVHKFVAVPGMSTDYFYCNLYPNKTTSSYVIVFDLLYPVFLRKCKDNGAQGECAWIARDSGIYERNFQLHPPEDELMFGWHDNRTRS